MAEELPAVEFNARIEPPFEMPVPTVPPPTPPTPQRMERETQTEPCCDYPSPPSPPKTYGDAALVEALPTILIGIAIAWVAGICTGAFIFSTPSME